MLKRALKKHIYGKKPAEMQHACCMSLSPNIGATSAEEENNCNTPYLCCALKIKDSRPGVVC